MLQKWNTWLRKRSLIFKLSTGILGGVMIGVMLLLFFISKYSEPIIVSQIMEMAEKSIQRSVVSLSETAIEMEQAATSLKNSLNKIPADDSSTIRILLQSTVQTLDYENSNFANAWVYVFENDDIRTGELYSGEGKNSVYHFNKVKITDFYRSYPWFKAVPKEEKIFWSEPYIDVEDAKKPLVVTCMIPFKFKGSPYFDGLVSVSVNLTDIQKEIAEFQFNETGRLLLLSRQGRYIVHPDKTVELKKTIFELAKERNLPQLSATGHDLASGKSGHKKMPDLLTYGHSVIMFYAPVPYLNWGICLVFSQKKFFKPIYDFQLRVLVALLLGLVLLFLIISLVCHLSTKPLLNLSKVAEQYGKGVFSAELPAVYSTDEIGVMTKAFHRMRDDLLEHIALEKKVVSEQQKSKSELEIAHRIQLSALPTDYPCNPYFEISAMMRSAQKVGGDFYDFFYTDEKHFVILAADVAGKGIPAALYMMTAKAMLKNALEAGFSLETACYRVNNELCRANGETHMFLTAFIAMINIKSGKVTYVNAGHNPPLIYGVQKKYKVMNTNKNIVLGAMEDMRFKSQTLSMSAGSRLFLYTDGVTEAQNKKGEFYGMDRLHDVLNSEQLRSAADTLDMVNSDMEKFSNGAEQSDDVTMLEFVYNGDENADFIINAEVKQCPRFMHFVEQDMQQKRVNVNIRESVLVAAEEIFANVAMYAYERCGYLRVSTFCKNGKYTIVFKDRGKPFDPLKASDPDITLNASERKVGGLGIFMVKKVAQKVEYTYENGQNILQVSFA